MSISQGDVADDHLTEGDPQASGDRNVLEGRADEVWDLLVVGGGTAGIVGARTVASFGASVLMVERDRPGGDCLWTGCVPSKALLAAASAAADARAAGRVGVHVEGVWVDFGEVMAHVRAAIAAIEPADSPETLRGAGVQVVRGSARFTGAGSARVDGVGGGGEVRFRQALIATGSAPAVPPIPGLREAAPLTSDTVWDLRELPDRLVVLGGGTIGCELGQAFARLGSTVTIVEAADRLLGNEDPEAAQLVTEAIVRDGATVLTGAPVSAVEDAAGGREVVLEDGRRVRADAVLVALGRRPSTADVGLDAAGVEVDDSGFVVVDPRLRTTNPRIWAAGDVSGHPQFTHVAGVHASTAVSNAVLGLRRTAEVRAVPRVTYTAPEVAAVGVGADEPGVTVRTVRHDEVDRAVAEGRTSGFSRLVLDRRGRVVGATVVGPRAGETLAELTLAVRSNAKAGDLAGTMHPYPTFGDGPWNAAVADVRARLAAPFARRATDALVTMRRTWLELRAQRRTR
ncbi:dihydrolipoyl dehydrogenase family protein [Pseudonocardia nigra]|uniref:dihydrolipoyl dehydrogenase family protein n=1 Tax=Pseudonocardia nigra TaxID=1921578 RepID=UPI001C5FF4C9|nr:FAD-dependent oxidoreductase [Pseudonocardia nigra]